MSDILSLLHDEGQLQPGDVDSIETALMPYGAHALTSAFNMGVRIRMMRHDEQYRQASPFLVSMGVNVDDWPHPPAGLFVVQERTMYLRSRSCMAIAHEFGHALDCTLGGGVYASGLVPEIREAYRDARQFVTPYAASSLDEYFAECARAFVEVNDEASVWPRVSRAKLKRYSPTMYGYLKRVLEGAA